VTTVEVHKNALRVCPRNTSVWEVKKQRDDVCVYGPNVDFKMDWRINPWNQVLGTPDVRWLMRSSEGAYVAHFSHFDVTVGEAAGALHGALEFADARAAGTFAPQFAVLWVYCIEKRKCKQWPQSSRLHDVLKHSASKDCTIHCRFM